MTIKMVMVVVVVVADVYFVCCEPDTVLNIVSMLTTTLQHRHYYFHHFLDGETETQMGEASVPAKQSDSTTLTLSHLPVLTSPRK
jgi:hypothetical protein